MRRGERQFKRRLEMTGKLMMMFAAVAVSFGAWAETETVGGYTWTYRINCGTAEMESNGECSPK